MLNLGVINASKTNIDDTQQLITRIAMLLKINRSMLMDGVRIF